MFRIAIVSGITLFTVVAANAGQIQIGGANGLTSSTVTGAGCSTGGPCTEQGYVPVMFQSALVAPPVGPGSLVDTSSGVTFSKINDTGNFWDLPTGTATSTLTVPIGLFGVTDVWTMINDIESVNARDITVSFNFGTSSTVTSFTDNVLLTNANTGHTGQVANALVCNVGCAANTQVAPTSGTVLAGVTVNSDQVWSQSFDNCLRQNPLAVSTSTSSDIGCSGTAYLDDQGFFFNGLTVGAGLTNLNTYLVSIQVKEITGAGGGAGLSAITVDQASATPEPSTVLLFVAGLGVVGLGRLRKRA